MQLTGSARFLRALSLRKRKISSILKKKFEKNFAEKESTKERCLLTKKGRWINSVDQQDRRLQTGQKQPAERTKLNSTGLTDVGGDKPTRREQEGAGKGPAPTSGTTAGSGARPSTFPPRRGGQAAPPASQTPQPAAPSAGSGGRPCSPAASRQRRQALLAGP